MALHSLTYNMAWPCIALHNMLCPLPEPLAYQFLPAGSFYFIFSKTSPNKDRKMSGTVKRLWLVILKTNCASPWYNQNVWLVLNTNYPYLPTHTSIHTLLYTQYTDLHQLGHWGQQRWMFMPSPFCSREHSTMHTNTGKSGHCMMCKLSTSDSTKREMNHRQLAHWFLKPSQPFWLYQGETQFIKLQLSKSFHSSRHLQSLFGEVLDKMK